MVMRTQGPALLDFDFRCATLEIVHSGVVNHSIPFRRYIPHAPEIMVSRHIVVTDSFDTYPHFRAADHLSRRPILLDESD